MVDVATAVFSGEGITNFEVGVSEVADLRIGEDPTLGIGDIQQSATKMRFDQSTISIFNASGQTASLHDMSGKSLGIYRANAQGTILIPVSHLNSSIIVLSLSNGKTYKIQKR